MKQHITTDQLNELSDKGEERLREWWRKNHNPGDMIYSFEEISDENRYSPIHFYMFPDDHKDIDTATIKSGFYGAGGFRENEVIHSSIRFRNETWIPLLSIGQMIEFLHDSKFYSSKSYIDNFFNFNNTIECDKVQIGWYGEELCDALWEAVREVLEK